MGAFLNLKRVVGHFLERQFPLSVAIFFFTSSTVKRAFAKKKGFPLQSGLFENFPLPFKLKNKTAINRNIFSYKKQ